VGGSSTVPTAVATDGSFLYVYDGRIGKALDPTTGAELTGWPTIAPPTWTQFLALGDQRVISMNFATATIHSSGPDGVDAVTPYSNLLSTFSFLTEDGRSLIIADADGGRITSVDPDSLTVVPMGLHLKPDPNSFPAISLDGRSLARVVDQTAGKVIHFYDLRTGRSTRADIALPSLAGDVNAMTYNSTGTALAISSGNGNLGELDLRTGGFRDTKYRGLSGQVLSFGYSTDDTAFFGISQDSQLRWWDVRTGDPIGDPITASAAAISTAKAAGFTDYQTITGDVHAKRFAVIGDDGLRVWNYDFSTWPAIACDRAGRNLTRAEWDEYMPAGEPYHRTCPHYAAGT
jgi:WD40 repeat protein